jgi:S-adenosylmethionine synthetase
LLGNIDLGGMMAKFNSLMENVMPKIAGSAHRIMQSQQAMKMEQIAPLIRKDAKRVRLTYGPYMLKGRKVLLLPS